MNRLLIDTKSHLKGSRWKNKGKPLFVVTRKKIGQKANSQKEHQIIKEQILVHNLKMGFIKRISFVIMIKRAEGKTVAMVKMAIGFNPSKMGRFNENFPFGFSNAVQL